METSYVNLNSTLLNQAAANIFFQIPDSVNTILDYPLTDNSEYLNSLTLMHNLYAESQGWFQFASHNWLENNCKIEVKDFLLNGKFAWLFLPSYLHIPQLFLSKLEIYDLDEETKQMLWLKIRYTINQANAQIESEIFDDFILETPAPPSPWHIYTSKFFKAQNNPNIIDHIQQFSAHKFFVENKNLRSFTKKDIYDLFVRPLERLFSADSKLSERMLKAVHDIATRNDIITLVFEISNLETYNIPFFDAHYLLHKLSKIRHLSFLALSNKNKNANAVTLINQFNVYNPSTTDVKFNDKTMNEIEDVLITYLLNTHNEPSAVAFPLSFKLLDLLAPFGGRNINLTNQALIQQKIIDLRKAALTLAIEKSNDYSFPLFSSSALRPSTFVHSSSPKNTHLPSSFSSPSLSFSPINSPHNPINLPTCQFKNLDALLEKPSKLTRKNVRTHELSTRRALLPELLRCARSFNDRPEQPHDMHDDDALTKDLLTPRSRDLTPPPTKLFADARSDEDDIPNFSFSTWQSSSSLRNLQTPTQPSPPKLNMSKSLADLEINPKPTLRYSSSWTRAPVQIPRTDSSSAAATASAKFQSMKQPQQPLLHPQGASGKAEDDQPSRFNSNWSDVVNPNRRQRYQQHYQQQQHQQQQPRVQPNRDQYAKISFQQMQSDQQRYSTPSIIIPSAMNDSQPPSTMREFQSRMSLASGPRQSTPIPPSPPSNYRPAPKGKLNSTIYPWDIVKRNKDRRSNDRIPMDYTEEQLQDLFVVPETKESYVSLFWMSTMHGEMLNKTPEWASIPHSAHSITFATESDPITPESNPDRFKNSINLCMFPMDDGLHNRDITFTTLKFNNDWFLQIKEEIQFPNGSIDDSFINIEWSKVDTILQRLELILHMPFPPAKEVATSDIGLYTTRKITDTYGFHCYYTDVIHKPHGKGYIRMVNITQEKPQASMEMSGNIEFPWHLLHDFVERLRSFKDGKQ